MALVLSLAVLMLTMSSSSIDAADDATVIDARLGPCTAAFTVVDGDGKPAYNATIHVRIRYGALGVKRMDLEIGTDSEGKARVQGLPEKARPFTYEIAKGDRKTTVSQDVARDCKATFNVTLK